MRADRLISLLMLLQTRGQMTAQELADRLEVSTRTIYRDLDALSGAGVPVYAERGPQGGCRLLESYRTNLTGLKEGEVHALFMLTVPGLLADLGADRAAETALLKLSAALPLHFQKDAERVRQRLHLDPAGWFQMAEPVPFLPMLQQAVWEEQRVRMTYRRSDGAHVARLIEPYGLVAKAAIWYVIARSLEWVQVFRVSRIQEAELTGTNFVRDKEFDLAAHWGEWSERFERGMERYQVTLRVSLAGAPLLVKAFGEGMHGLLAQADSEAGTNNVLLALTFSSAEDACRQLLGVGREVEVVAPLELRQLMHERATCMAVLYQD